MATFINQVFPWMQKLISEFEDRMEKSVEAKIDQKV